MKKLVITILITLLVITVLTPQAQTQKEKFRDDQVSKEIVTIKLPKKLAIPENQTFQQQARYRNSYIFVESFEDDKFSSAFHKKKGILWQLQKGKAKNGEGMAVFKESLVGLSEQDIAEDVNNWLIVGPFDLSSPREADFNFYIQLGEARTNQSASLAVLVSVDGSAFYGYKFGGTTLDWFYRNLDLTQVPYLGNVCGKSSVWFAFVPGHTPLFPGGKIALDYLRLLTYHPGLPARFKIPKKPINELRKAPNFYHVLTEWYSPVVVQELDCTEYGDYITRINYDADYIGNNNWDNLGYPTKALPLPAYVYCSVIETETHYFICYALFHPADDFHCHTFPHENDLEGIIMCVLKDGSTYGQLRMVQLQAHYDFYQYIAPGATGIYDSNEDIDGLISFDDTFPGVHPIVYVEGGGHGIRHKVTLVMNGPYVSYYYIGIAQDPDIVGRSHCGYDLLSVFAEIWGQRANCCGSGHLFDNWGSYQGRRLMLPELGRKFDGDDSNPIQGPDAASPPWNWADNDDDPPWKAGDWFIDSAWYHDWQFRWDEEFAIDYIVHPFMNPVNYGDVSDDGNNTTYDASLILRYVVGLIELSPDEKNAADVTGDDTVSALDAAMILQYTVGLITGFPVDSPSVAPALNLPNETKLLTKAIEQLDTIYLTKEEKQVLEQLKNLLFSQLIPRHTALLQNFPNPFNPETWIPFQLATNTPVTIHIYNVNGQLVRTISLGYKNAGIYVTKDKAAYWNGRNNMGERVSSGTYFVTLQTGKKIITRRMSIIK